MIAYLCIRLPGRLASVGAVSAGAGPSPQALEVGVEAAVAPARGRRSVHDLGACFGSARRGALGSTRRSGTSGLERGPRAPRTRAATRRRAPEPRSSRAPAARTGAPLPATRSPSSTIDAPRRIIFQIFVLVFCFAFVFVLVLVLVFVFFFFVFFVLASSLSLSSSSSCSSLSSSSLSLSLSLSSFDSLSIERVLGWKSVAPGSWTERPSHLASSRGSTGL